MPVVSREIDGRGSVFWYAARVAEPCPQCETLRADLREARDQRDAALLAVAVEREKANAVLLSQLAAVPAPPAEKPLRYWVVDAISDGFKKALPWPHKGLRAAARLLHRSRKADP